jgi:hypothetical protein
MQRMSFDIVREVSKRPLPSGVFGILLMSFSGSVVTRNISPVIDSKYDGEDR